MAWSLSSSSTSILCVFVVRVILAPSSSIDVGVDVVIGAVVNMGNKVVFVFVFDVAVMVILVVVVMVLGVVGVAKVIFFVIIFDIGDSISVIVISGVFFVPSSSSGRG